MFGAQVYGLHYEKLVICKKINSIFKNRLTLDGLDSCMFDSQ